MKTKVIFDDFTVSEETYRISQEISDYYLSRVSDSDPLLVMPILNGGIFFYVHLIETMENLPTNLGVISTSLYPSSSEARETLAIKYMDSDVKDRQVLLVDEICYTGTTLEAVKNYLYSLGAKDVKTVSLVYQEKENSVHKPDWFCLKYKGNDWLFGKGMDFKGRYREKLDIVAEDTGNEV